MKNKCPTCSGPIRNGRKHHPRTCSAFSLMPFRFWEKAAKSEGCWEWTGAKDRKGYGRFSVIGSRAVFAHRKAWELTHGVDLSPDQLVCHHCDNPGCVRPDHLFLGTPKENTADMYRKGRARFCPPKGEAHGQTKLTAEQVADIRRRRRDGESAIQLGREYGISATTVYNIQRRKVWDDGKGPDIVKNGTTPLTIEDARAIRQAKLAGESARVLSKRYGVGVTTIYNIANGVTWAKAADASP